MLKQLIIPNTEITVSRLSFGTSSLHHLPSSIKRQELLFAAHRSGFTHFDTAPYYGLGLAEIELGNFLSKQKNVSVATKIGLYPITPLPPTTISVYLHKAVGKIFPSITRPQVNWSLQKCEKSMHLSLKRLQIERIDILFLHEPIASMLPADELHNWLQKQKQAGKIRYWGLAGVLDKYTSLIEQEHPLSQIIQMQDSVQYQQSTVLKKWARKPQFTYGYMSSRNSSQTPEDILKEACMLNSTGSILVSTRQVERVKQYTQILETIEPNAGY